MLSAGFVSKEPDTPASRTSPDAARHGRLRPRALDGTRFARGSWPCARPGSCVWAPLWPCHRPEARPPGVGTAISRRRHPSVPDPEAGSPEAACGSPLSRGHVGCARLCPPPRPLREEGSWCRWSFCPGSCFWSPLNASTRRSQQHGRSYTLARGDCGRSTASAEGAGLLVCVSS